MAKFFATRELAGGRVHVLSRHCLQRGNFY